MRRVLPGFFVVAACLLFAGSALAAWPQDQAQAQTLARAGDFGRAATLAAQAVKQAMAELDAGDPRLHELIIQAGSIHLQAGSKAAARRYLHFALIQLEKQGPSAAGRVWEVKQLLAQAQGPDQAPPPPPPPAPPAVDPAPPSNALPPGVQVTSVEIAEFGLYKAGETEPEGTRPSRQTYSDADITGQGELAQVSEVKHLETTDQVPNLPGVTFGMGAFVYGQPVGSPVPILIKLVTPPRVVDEQGNRVSIEEFDSEVTLGDGIWYGNTLSDAPEGRPAGQWIIQIFAGGRKVAEKVFTLGPPQ
jgi:hypothetical protein